VGAVYVSPVMFRGEPPALVELRTAIESAGVPLRELVAGDRLAAGPDTRLTVLHPVADIYYKSDNANSIVLEIEYAGTTLMLPGDLEPPGLQQLLAEEPRPTPIVMAPHHGSGNSNPQGFAAWSTPKYVVISGGRGHDDSPVNRAFSNAGAEVLHTAERGAIRFTITAAGTAVEPFRN
jgi:competence protein ComEC